MFCQSVFTPTLLCACAPSEVSIMRMKFRKRIRGTCNDIMKSSNSTCVNEFSSHDGDRSSVRSSDDGASSSPHGGDDRERTKLNAKKFDIMERLKQNNLAQAGNVEEYLLLTNKTEAQRGVDNPQMTRIRQQFEKKNKKYVQDSDSLKKKLNRLESRIAAIDNGLNESNGRNNPMASVGQGMRRTGAHIKGMTESVVFAPIEFANRLKNSFGSADNVNEVPALGDDSRVGQSVFYASSEHGSTHNSATKTKSSTLPAGIKMDLSSPTPSVQRNQSLHMHESNMSLPYQSLDPIYTSTPSHGDNVDDQMRSIESRLHRIEDMLEQITAVYKTEVADITRALDEERFKNKKLEDLVNETIELHQAEFLSLKQEQKNIASRLDYQYNDRFRQVEESAENVQNQICRLENSMKQALDVRLNGSVMGNSVLLNLVDILVTVLKLFLYGIATVLDVFRPFTGSRFRAGALLFIVIAVLVVLNYSDPISLFRKKPQLDSKEL